MDEQTAAEELFRAELALEDARQSGYDPWIAAAYEHLHQAVEEHLRASDAAGRTAAARS